MPFSITTPHPNISLVTFVGAFSEEDWYTYERQYRDLYVKHARAVIVFDLRKLEIQVGPIIKFINKKKDLLASLKPRTCRMLFAAVVVTEYEFVSEIVFNIVKASGQASLFYACSRLDEVLGIVGRLVSIMNNRKIEHMGGLSWKDVGAGSIAVILLAFFLRHSRHFLKKPFQDLQIL